MEAIQSNLPIVSSVLTGAATMSQGASQAQAARFRAAQLDRQAVAEQAGAQRKAIEQKRRADLLNSRLQAVAGGSGGDSTVVNLSAGIAGEGEYRALTALAAGDEQAAGLRDAAAVQRVGGKVAQQRGTIAALPSILSAGSTMYEKYGQADPFDAFYRRGSRRVGD